jgi:hypothetical protein
MASDPQYKTQVSGSLPDLSYKQLKALVLFQEIYKLKRHTVHNLNKTLDTIYKTLASISNNINTNYIADVISHENYKKYMLATDTLVNMLAEIPRPVSLRHLGYLDNLKNKV